MINYLHRHVEIAKEALSRLARNPISSLVSVIIIGIAITLPLLLFKITENIATVTGGWQSSDVITVYLVPSEDDSEKGVELAHDILRKPQVHDVRFLAANEVLEEFKGQSGFSELLDELESSPLPAMIYVFPESGLIDGDLSDLVSAIDEMSGVDQVSFDQQWQNRLKSIIELFEFAILVLAGLMALGVVLIVSNTVRLGILDRRDEIQIIDQIGGTASFVRRPFLYFGVFQGVFGALFALLLSTVILIMIASPVDQLAQLYNSQFKIQQLKGRTWIVVIFLSAILGWIAARLTAGGYIRRMRASERGK